MKLEMGPTWTRVTEATEKETAWLDGYLVFKDERARFHGGRAEIAMYRKGGFPSGLVRLVQRAAPSVGITVDVQELGPFPPIDPAAELGWLREDQRTALDVALRKRRGILWLPTTFGKTEVGIGAVRSVPSVAWLNLVHRATLVRQTAARFSLRNHEHGVDFGDPGMIAEGSWSEGEHLTCATFDALRAALRAGRPEARRLLERVGGILADEAHVVAAETIWEVTMATSEARYRVGMSATPLGRSDLRSIYAISALGPVIHRTHLKDLVAAGHASLGTVRFVRLIQDAHGSNYDVLYDQLVSLSSVRNGLLCTIARLAEKPALLFVRKRRHGRALEKLLWKAGVRTAFVDGAVSIDGRRSALRRLGTGDLDVLVSSKVLDTGEDVPFLRSIINGAAGRSVIETIQRAGRGTRIERSASGDVTKDSFTIWDVLDDGNDWLRTHARLRRKAYREEGYDVSDPVDRI